MRTLLRLLSRAWGSLMGIDERTAVRPARRVKIE
jgi:hypothetical protein